MRRQFAVYMALAGLLVASTASGQGRRFGARGGFDGGPAIGDELPDVTALDESGKEISLRSMRGKYTVLVFGCLT